MSLTLPGDTLNAPLLDALCDELTALRDAVATEGQALAASWMPWLERQDYAESAQNLACYLALRQRDLRALQSALMPFGLSSLGRLEGRVLANLDAVGWALSRFAGQPGPGPVSENRFFRGNLLLNRHSNRLFGPRVAPRRVRIVVTLPGMAAEDPTVIARLMAAGTDVFRINCAHDTPEAWRTMAGHIRKLEGSLGRPVRILMDLAGPKCRTGATVSPADGTRLQPGDRFTLYRPGCTAAAGAWAAECQLPEILAQLAPGQRVFVDDGKLAGVVECVNVDAVTLRVTRCGRKGGKLKPEKGLNFPDTALDIPALTDRDLQDLPQVCALADLIGYSFVQGAEDILRLQEHLADLRPRDWQHFGLVAKIETGRAVARLPEIMVAAAGRQPTAVMIARGDLAIEIGFERLAEMQEEIMWLAEAAHIPVIWATQVLESLVRKGLPSRGEMTDAAMSVRAEAVMLNKGPHLVEGVEALDRLLNRMRDHQDKKTPKLRALRTWQPERPMPDVNSAPAAG